MVKSYIIGGRPRYMSEINRVYEVREGGTDVTRVRPSIPTRGLQAVPRVDPGTPGAISIRTTDGAVVDVALEGLRILFPNLANLHAHLPVQEYNVPFSSKIVAIAMDAPKYIELRDVPAFLAYGNYSLRLDVIDRILRTACSSITQGYGNTYGSGGIPFFYPGVGSLTGPDLLELAVCVSETELPDDAVRRLEDALTTALQGKSLDALLHGPPFGDLPPSVQTLLAGATDWQKLPRRCWEKLPLPYPNVPCIDGSLVFRLPKHGWGYNGALHFRLDQPTRMPVGASLFFDDLSSTDGSGRTFTARVVRTAETAWEANLSFDIPSSSSSQVILEGPVMSRLPPGTSEGTVSMVPYDSSMAAVSFWIVEEVGLDF